MKQTTNKGKQSDKRKTITFRPTKKNEDFIIETLKQNANKENRTLNNYIEIFFMQHLTK